MTFYNSGNTEIYERNYKKLFEVIAQIGGFANGVFFSAYVILYWYTSNIIFWKSVLSILSPEEIKLSIKNENIRNIQVEFNSNIIQAEKVNIGRNQGVGVERDLGVGENIVVLRSNGNIFNNNPNENNNNNNRNEQRENISQVNNNHNSLDNLANRRVNPNLLYNVSR